MNIADETARTTQARGAALFRGHGSARRCVAWRFAAMLAVTLAPAAAAADAPPPGAAPSVIELQAGRQTTRGRVAPDSGLPSATLIDLNPLVHAWYLLEIRDPDGSVHAYHLQLPDPARQRLMLDAADGSRLLITDGGRDVLCTLSGANALEAAASRALPYVPLCEGHLYLRRQLRGSETALESVVEFMRDRVWGGEALVNAVKDQLADAERDTSAPLPAPSLPASASDGPPPARLAPEFADTTLAAQRIGIALEGSDGSALGAGRWYRSSAQRGVFVSVMQAGAVAPEILSRHLGSVNPLDAVERTALVYLVAFDLNQFEVAFAMGTGHPRVDWSPRALGEWRQAGVSGPDGFGNLLPLAMSGMVPPWHSAATAATFIGGFKRDHAAFRYGALARVNRGSHYGVVEQGVVLSSLNPGLATLYVLLDGSLHMTTWSERDRRKLPLLRYARQNGVALVERDLGSGDATPGLLVNRWGPGNWSGSNDSTLRALRAGLCLNTRGATPMLIYAYFSSATPSAMARVFQAYDCDYAMMLDMNALVHTYLALYRREGERVTVEHVVREMEQADPALRGTRVPRFLTTPDNRDFFYLMRRQTPASAP